MTLYTSACRLNLLFRMTPFLISPKGETGVSLLHKVHLHRLSPIAHNTFFHRISPIVHNTFLFTFVCMTAIKRLAGQTAIYGIPSVLGRILGYLLVPLYTYVFQPGDYGTVNVFYAYTSFLMVVLTYG